MHIKKSDSSCPNYFQRFTEGLATLGCLHALQQHPQIFERFMCYSEEKLTAKTLGKLFVVCCNGSKNGEKNKTTLGHWRDYLNNCEGHNGGVSLQDILKFATGLRSLPPAGFQPKPYLKFGSVTNLPQAYTSGNYIILPILSSYEHFKNNMDKGIQNPVRVSYV
uniref:G2/M phase-specific E3 ubiquitin-protein ligase-like n=1 Tax=Erpetoichthys calabaricus TaxID=27687 RepID=A0A8C4TB16_ERPCA